jgi:hypothetical protein
MKKTILASKGKQSPKSRAQQHFTKVAKLRADGAAGLIKKTADVWTKRQPNNAGSMWKEKNAKPN